MWKTARSESAARLGIFAAALMLAACGAAPPPTAAPAPKPAATSVLAATSAPAPSGIVSWMVAGDSVEFDAYKRIAAAFERANPAIKVDLVYIPASADYRNRLAADIASGAPSDVVFMNYQRYPPFADKNQLAPLGDYLSRSTMLRESDFFPAAMSPYKWRGSTWCLPGNMSSAVIYYNKKLFDGAKLDYPRANWSWDDFVASARAISRDDPALGRIYGYGTEISLFRVAPYVWSAGGDLVDSADAPTKLTLDSEVAMAAIQRYIDLQVKFQAAPSALAEKAEDSLTRFMNGKLGMYMDSRRVVPLFRDTIKDSFDWDVVALPSQGQTVSILHSDGYCIPAAAKNKDAAWALIEFAAGPRGQTTMTEIGRLVPSLRAIAESPVFLNPTVRPANSKVWLETPIRPVPNHKNWPAIETAITKELEKSYYGVQPVRDAVQIVGKQVATLLK
ncbi:MAG: sugar ABC transporter substrate-binding protein [Anaerolineae bacterium]|nr:sugar ABC transporter substrate-binding protein [Anaerolineae bacterium]